MRKVNIAGENDGLYTFIRSTVLRVQVHADRIDIVWIRTGSVVASMKTSDKSNQPQKPHPRPITLGQLHFAAANPLVLVDEFWTLPPPGAIATSTLAAAFRSAGLPAPRNSVVTYSLQLHYALMATGRYLAAIPVLHFNTKRPDLAVVPIDVPLRPGPAGIVTLKDRTLNPVAQIFIKTARELSIPLKKMI